MRKEILKISVVRIISILTVLVVEYSKNIREACIGSIYASCKLVPEVHNYIDIPTSTVITAEELKIEDYAIGPENYYTFIKDLSQGNEPAANAKDVIVVDDIYVSKLAEDSVYICFYSEENENKMVKKTCINRKDMKISGKSILIIPHGMWEREIFMNRVKAAEDANQMELSKIRGVIDFMMRFIIFTVCNKYINHLESDKKEKEIRSYMNAMMELDIVEERLEYVTLSNLKTCKLINKVLIYNEKRNLIRQKEAFEFTETKIKHLLELNNSDMLSKETQKKFNEDTKVLTSQLKYSREKYKKCPIEEMQRMGIDDTVMLINILTNGKLSLNIEQIIDRIQKNFTEEQINDEMGLKIAIDKEELIKHAEPWKRGLLELLIARLMEHIECNDEVTHEEARKENEKLIKETEEKINDYNNGHRNTIVLRSMFSTGITEINEILNTRRTRPFTVDKDENEKNEIAEENKKIVAILGNMSVDQNSINPSETAEEIKEKILAIISQIAEAYNSTNDPTEILEVAKQKKGLLHSLYTNLFSTHQQIKEEPSTIIEVIEQKKQEILSLVFKNIYKTTYKYVIDMEIYIRQVVEAIVNIVIDAHIGPINSNVISALKEIVKREKKEIIADQRLNDRLKPIFKIFKKYWYTCRKNIHFNVYDFTFGLYLDRIINIFKNHKKTNNWLVSNVYAFNSTDIHIIYQLVCLTCSYIREHEFHTEIWKNPIFLIATKNMINSETGQQQAYIIYNSPKKETDIYKKTINYTQTNLTAFKNAKTFKDIKNIKGKAIIIRNTCRNFVYQGPYCNCPVQLQ